MVRGIYNLKTKNQRNTTTATSAAWLSLICQTLPDVMAIFFDGDGVSEEAKKVKM